MEGFSSFHRIAFTYLLQFTLTILCAFNAEKASNRRLSYNGISNWNPHWDVDSFSYPGQSYPVDYTVGNSIQYDEDQFGKYLGKGWSIPSGIYGRDVELVCEFSPYDNIISNIIWYRVPGNIHGQQGYHSILNLPHRAKSYTRTFDRMIQGVLRIENLGFQDYGDYVCMASSDRSRWLPRPTRYQDNHYNHFNNAPLSLHNHFATRGKHFANGRSRELDLQQIDDASTMFWTPKQTISSAAEPRSNMSHRQSRQYYNGNGNYAFRRTTVTVYKIVSLLPNSPHFPPYFAAFSNPPLYY